MKLGFTWYALADHFSRGVDRRCTRSAERASYPAECRTGVAAGLRARMDPAGRIANATRRSALRRPEETDDTTCRADDAAGQSNYNYNDHHVDARSSDDNPYDPLLEPPPLPKGKTTLIGGIATNVDHVRNRMTVQPFGKGTQGESLHRRALAHLPQRHGDDDSGHSQG